MHNHSRCRQGAPTLSPCTLRIFRATRPFCMQRLTMPIASEVLSHPHKRALWSCAKNHWQRDEGNLKSLRMAHADAPITPAMDAETVNFVLYCCPDEEELIDKGLLKHWLRYRCRRAFVCCKAMLSVWVANTTSCCGLTNSSRYFFHIAETPTKPSLLLFFFCLNKGLSPEYFPLTTSAEL